MKSDGLGIQPGRGTLFWLMLALLFFNNCSHNYYAPNPHHVPLFEQKNDARISGGLSVAEEFVAVQFDGAYAPGDHFAVLASYYNANSDNACGFFSLSCPSDEKIGWISYGEAALGYYESGLSVLIFECYGGFGLGKSERNYVPGSSSLRFSKTYVQPNLGISTKNFDVAFSPKLAVLNFHKLHYDHALIASGNTGAISSLDYIKYNKTSFLFEPALTVRVGSPMIRLQLQAGLSLNIKYPENPQEVVNASIGLLVRIADKYR